MNERSITPFIKRDLKTKIVLLSGPRQVGKTTLVRSLTPAYEYLNYDSVPHRALLLEQSWKRDTDLIIFDELHKMRNWKGWLKGIFDAEGLTPPIIVTGSARLDIAKRMGDSLAGRHFSFRLNPLTIRDLKEVGDLRTTFERLLSQGGFPEPFFNHDPYFYPRWQRTHLDIILRQDLIDLESVRRLTDIETLIELLRSRVGSLVSYQSLAEDLQTDPSTVRRWLTLLENLFVIFRVSPWSRNISRSLLKAGKYYFYDTGQVEGDSGARLENLVAVELLSAINFEQDTKGRKLSLHFLRNKEKDEIDFAVVDGTTVTHMIEVKWNDDSPSKSFLRLKPKGSTPAAFQIVGELSRDKEYPFGVKVVTAFKWLAELQL